MYTYTNQDRHSAHAFFLAYWAPGMLAPARRLRTV